MCNPPPDLKAILLAEHKRAKRTIVSLQKTGSPFVPHVVIVKPDGSLARRIPDFTDGDHKYRSMALIASSARMMNAAAVILISDAWYVRADRFCAHFGLPDPVRDVEEFMPKYHLIIEAYSGRIANLPTTLRSEGLSSAMKSPILTTLLMQRYTREHGSILFEKLEEPEQAEAYVIPDWWSPYQSVSQ